MESSFALSTSWFCIFSLSTSKDMHYFLGQISPDVLCSVRRKEVSMSALLRDWAPARASWGSWGRGENFSSLSQVVSVWLFGLLQKALKPGCAWVFGSSKNKASATHRADFPLHGLRRMLYLSLYLNLSQIFALIYSVNLGEGILPIKTPSFFSLTMQPVRMRNTKNHSSCSLVGRIHLTKLQ